MDEMLGKAIAQAAGVIQRAEAPIQNAVLGAGAIAGLAAEGQGNQQQRRDRTVSEAFLEEGLVGVVSDKIRSRGKTAASVNQEAVGNRQRDQRGRFQPIARPLVNPLQPPMGQEPPIIQQRRPPNGRPPRNDEDRKTPDYDEQDALLQPPINQQQPAAEVTPVQELRQELNLPPMPEVADRPVQQDDVVPILERAGVGIDLLRNSRFVQMAGSFLVGQVLTIDGIFKIINSLLNWWQVSSEHETLNDPIYESLTIEQAMQRPIPPQCKRIIYRDTQTNELKTIVTCGEQGSERFYFNR